MPLSQELITGRMGIAGLLVGVGNCCFGCAIAAEAGRIDRMSSELTVALISAGSAIAGALAGGAAAVWAATRAARSTYLGPLHVAQKTAQQQAYVQLMSAANEFEAGMNSVSGAARALIEAAANESEGIPHRLDEAGRRRRRGEIRAAADVGRVRAAVRLVDLAGPTVVVLEAKLVEEAARRLSRAFREAGMLVEEDDGMSRPAMTEDQLLDLYEALLSALDKFAVTARENGGHGGGAAL